MYKKFLIIIILLSFLSVAGFGCKGLSTEERAAVKKITVNYWTVFDDVTQLEKFAAEYEKIRPHVDIRIRQVRYDEFDRLFTNALADDVAPDIVSMHVRWLNKYASRLSPMPSEVQVGRLVKTGKYSDAVEVVMDTHQLPSLRSIESNYVKTVYNDIVIGGKVYGLPLAVDTMAVFYNKDILDRASIPEPPKNWDEFMEAVIKTTRFDASGKIIQAGTALGTGSNIDNAFDIISLFMLQSGRPKGMSMAANGRVLFDTGLNEGRSNHPALQALTFYTDFANPTMESYTWNSEMENAFTAFTQGKVAFYFGFAYDYPRIKSRAQGMTIEVLPMFQLGDDTRNYVNVANYWVQSVVKKSKHQNEAWDFVRYITSASSVKKYSEATSRPSPYRSHIEEQQQNEQLAPFVSQLLIAENWYRGRDIDTATKAFNDLVTNYLKPHNSEEESKTERDVRILKDTARIVQQTM